MTPTTKNKFKDAVTTKLREAEQLFNVDLSKLSLEFNIRGNRIAGQVMGTRCRITGKPYDVRLRFNPAAVEEHCDDMIETTVPHEIAHLVCMMKPVHGKNHDAGWQRVCRMLGGNGKRCHDMKFGTPRGKVTYIYMTTSGVEVSLTKIRHNRIQKGTSYRYGPDGSEINARGFVQQKAN